MLLKVGRCKARQGKARQAGKVCMCRVDTAAEPQVQVAPPFPNLESGMTSFWGLQHEWGPFGTCRSLPGGAPLQAL